MNFWWYFRRDNVLRGDVDAISLMRKESIIPSGDEEIAINRQSDHHVIFMAVFHHHKSREIKCFERSIYLSCDCQVLLFRIAPLNGNIVAARLQAYIRRVCECRK